MITRIAADGKASGMLLISHPDDTDDETIPLCSPGCESPGCCAPDSPDAVGRPKGRMRKRTKLLRFTIGLLILGLVFLAQITISVTLKRKGIISKDLHDIVSERLLSPVAEHVIPELQNRLEHFESRMLDAIEMAKFMAPNFNETVYWGAVSEVGTARTVTTQEKLRPGFQLAQKHDTQDKHPVVMIPGFITSGLEVWKGKSCMENLFRERVWGGLGSAPYWLRERYCMMENLALDPVTGGDPEGIKVRSAQGFAAADYFIGNDWMCKYYPLNGWE